MATGFTPEPLKFRGQTWDWSRPYIMGVINVTPDSFSDGGSYSRPSQAVAHAKALVDAGADILDIGGESTRPGAIPVSADEELERVMPVIDALMDTCPAVLSIDTSKSQVARAAVAHGVECVNDISGGAFDPDVPVVAAELGCTYVLGHVRGQTIAQVHSARGHAITFEQVVAELGERLSCLPAQLAGRTIVDPGLGFGKGTRDNLLLSHRSGELAARLQCGVMVGPSRKRFLGELTGKSADARDSATIGAALAAFQCGAHIVRVHDVAGVFDAMRVYRAVMAGQA